MIGLTIGSLMFGFSINQVSVGAAEIETPATAYTVNSGGFPVKIYNDPECTQFSGDTLSVGIDMWKVVREASEGTNKVALDLGDNQWVDAKNDVDVIRTDMIFLDGVTLYNRNGSQTGTISGAYGYYRIFGVTTINGATYVNLGDSNQWAKFTAGSVN